MKALGDGEDSRTYRVRAGQAVLDWWGSLSAEGRGEVLAGLLASDSPVKVGAAMAEGSGAPASAEAGERLTLGVTVLRLTPFQRWVIDAMKDGGTLSRQPGGPWVLCHTAGNADTVREDTIRNLLSLNALREV